MTEPKPTWTVPQFTQCPAYFYSMGTNWLCQLPVGHEGSHYAPDGRWDPVSYTMTDLYWSGAIRLNSQSGAEKSVAPVAYLAGPMTGRKDWGFPAFYKAEEKAKGMGYEVINPAREFGGATDLPREVYMRRAIENVLRADVVLTLRGWKQSPGACLEVAVAKACGVEVKSL